MNVARFFCGCTALIAVSFALAADEPKDAKALPSLWMLKKAERDAGNPLAKYADMLRLEREYLADRETKAFFPELKAMLEEELGDPAAPMRGIEFMRGPAPAEKPVPDKAPFDGYKPTEAVAAIVTAAADRRAIMVGEEHHLPQTRSILVPLLRALRQNGFEYFAAETFSQDIAATQKLGYPTTETGTYTNDPVFADGVREAMKLGYKLIPYEFDFRKVPANATSAERNGFREKDQAKNLKERLFDKDPKAKALIWAGRGHVSKANVGQGDSSKMMAQHFQDMTGIEPYSVYAAHFYEVGQPGHENPLYRYATAKGLVERPTIFVSPDGKGWTRGPGLDAEVFFPRVKPIDGRPDWLARDLGRTPYRLPPEMQRGEGLRLVQAHYDNEPDRALPADQVLWRPEAPAPALMLPPGQLRLRVINAEGAVLASGLARIGDVSPPPIAARNEPTAQDMIDRHEKEKSPVWIDGDTATFFYQGDAEQVMLAFSGERIAFRHLPDSRVWLARVKKPDMAKGIFTYMILPGKKGEPPFKSGQALPMQRWRGPEAPPAAERAEKLTGETKIIDFESKALRGTRKIRVYLPPGHDRTKQYPVIFATDGNDGGAILEPLIKAGKIPPVIGIATSSGDYLGDRAAGYDIKKDLRALEYLSGEDAERYAQHETFFCEEVAAWAEQEFGASKERIDRAVFGCSNGARFAVDMGVRHPDLFGHVIAFSVAGSREFKVPEKAAGLPQYHLAAGTWEPFLKITKLVADELKAHSVAVTFTTRVAGHDPMMWEEELAAAATRALSKAN
jgi:enterochelin esterase-like enzyme